MKSLRLALGTFVFCAGVTGAASATNLYSVEFAGPTPLYLMNQATGAASAVGATGFDGIGDLTSDTRAGHGEIYGVRIASNQLLKIDPTTGAASLAANLNSPNNMVSLALDPTTGKLYGNTSVGYGAPFDALYEIDPGTGNCSFIGRILFDDVFALGFSQGGKLYGIADATDQLIGISTASGNGSLIASLQVNSAFDIASRPEDDVMFLVDTGTHRLWNLNTSNGNLTDVGAYGGASPNLVGLAFSQVPEPAALGLLAVAIPALALRRRRA